MLRRSHTAVLAILVALWWGPKATASCPDRWVHVMRWLYSDADVEAIREIAKAASAKGFTGLLLDAGLDCLDTFDATYLERVREVRRICDQYGLEPVPLIFSVGYGRAALRHDRNLAEGLPVTNALFIVQGREAHLQPDPPVEVANGTFESFGPEDRFVGLGYQESPGKISFADQQTRHGGHTAIRFQDIREHNTAGKARVAWDIPVRPHAQYRVSAWMRSEGLTPPSAFRVEAYGESGSLNFVCPLQQPTVNWTRVVLTFNSRHTEALTLWMGTWGAEQGRFWLDDVTIEEIGFRRIIRRFGAPLVVTSEDGQTVYEEGRDFEPVQDPLLGDWTGEGESPPLRLTAQSRIRDGERLRVSFYHAAVMSWKLQVPLCMSNPDLYVLWEKQAQLISEYLRPRAYFLDMDEIRAGGTCAACKARNQTMGEILGSCIQRQVQMLREVTPGAAVWIWSDMLDPSHNAHGNFHLVEGDFTGSWDHVPKDLVIACWGSPTSARFFAEKGFAIAAAICCDGGDLAPARNWLEILKQTPRVQGVVYVTWANNYELLAPFGDLFAAP